MGGKFVGRDRVRRRRGEWRDVKIVELDCVVDLGVAKLGLAIMGGSADKMDRDVEAKEEAREVEKLIQMTLRWQRYHDNNH